MDAEKKKIRLGFTDKEFTEGAHICQIFNSDEERHEILMDYVIAGVNSNEKTSCFSENETTETLAQFFGENGINYSEIEKKGAVSLSKTGEVYFEDDKFEPQRMLDLLKGFYLSSEEKYEGARVIGEMTPHVSDVEGGSQLLEYECKVSMLQREFPVTAVCQYDARQFDGATILDVLKVHPYMIVRGTVVNNPFYIKPEDFLKSE